MCARLWRYVPPVVTLIHMTNTIVTHDAVFGSLWTIGWLFTVGYLHLKFWKGVLALFVWPYYIGVKFRK